MLYHVNKVAEAVEKEYPGVWVETLAYMYTRQPPKTIRPRQNVLIRLAVIERSGAQPLDGEMNPALMDDRPRWKLAAPDLFIWDRVANNSGPLAPHPTLPVCASVRCEKIRDTGVVNET